ALHALSKPHVDKDTGEHDPRTPGTRRLDALVTMAKHATNPDKPVRGSGAAARIIVTIPLADLVSGVRKTSLAEQLGLLPTQDEEPADRADLDAPTPDSGAVTGCAVGRGPRAEGERADGCSAGHSRLDGDDEPRVSVHAPRVGGDGPCCGGVQDSTTNGTGSGVLGSGVLGHDTIRSSIAGCGTTRYGQVLSPADVRMLACDAQIIPAVLGTRSELLDLGHAHRLAKPGLATALELRDKTCTYPGCRIPAAWTDKHHITHWANGGPTTKGNMCCLCRHHHTVVHRHGHVATVTPYGVTWTRADGTPIGNQPRPDTTADDYGREPSPGALIPERKALPSDQLTCAT
ncbi:hypothetical protein KILIM_014_00010, partial [Kineosphaera limosa NBRC 100340]